jgi:beta-glucosidase-like glycosyl hydrolase
VLKKRCNVCCWLQVVATCKHFLGYGVEGAEGHSRCDRTRGDASI